MVWGHFKCKCGQWFDARLPASPCCGMPVDHGEVEALAAERAPDLAAERDEDDAALRDMQAARGIGRHRTHGG